MPGQGGGAGRACGRSCGPALLSAAARVPRPHPPSRRLHTPVAPGGPPVPCAVRQARAGGRAAPGRRAAGLAPACLSLTYRLSSASTCASSCPRRSQPRWLPPAPTRHPHLADDAGGGGVRGPAGLRAAAGPRADGRRSRGLPPRRLLHPRLVGGWVGGWWRWAAGWEGVHGPRAGARREGRPAGGGQAPTTLPGAHQRADGQPAHPTHSLTRALPTHARRHCCSWDDGVPGLEGEADIARPTDGPTGFAEFSPPGMRCCRCPAACPPSSSAEGHSLPCRQPSTFCHPPFLPRPAGSWMARFKYAGHTSIALESGSLIFQVRRCWAAAASALCERSLHAAEGAATMHPPPPRTPCHSH